MRHSIIFQVTLFLTSTASLTNASCWNVWDESYPCRDLLALRGGATTFLSATVDAIDSVSDNDCRMELNDVSLSLRYTCEMNRRLLAAAKIQASIHDSAPEINRSDLHPAVSMQRGGQMVHVHPSQQWEPPIRTSSEESEDLTPFHAQIPRETRTGVNRWGPDLLLYLQHLTTILNIQEDPLVLQLAILYLDRACSVETPRSHGEEKCPFLVPRTVHRLLLTSLLIATNAVHPTHDVSSPLSLLGIPIHQLDQMQDYMRQSLGDMGVYVSQNQLSEFNETWEQTFRSRKLKIRRRKPPSPLIRPMSQNGQCLSQDSTRGDEAFMRDHVSEAALQCWA